MESSKLPVVFFDIGDTLASVKILNPPYRLRLNVFPYARVVLEQLKRKNIRLGIISNTPKEETFDSMKILLESADIYKFFDPELLIYSSVVGERKNSPKIFKLAAKKAGNETTLENCVFVGEDPQERAYAREAGFLVAPHPLLVEDVLGKRYLRYVKITIPSDKLNENWQVKLRELRFVPMYITGEQGSVLYAITSTQTALLLDDLGFYVDRIGEEDKPSTTELYLIRDDRQARTGFLNANGQCSSLSESADKSKLVLSSCQEGIVLAIPAGMSIEGFHFEEAYHGHNLKLMMDINLLSPFEIEKSDETAPLFSFIVERERSLSDDELKLIKEISNEEIRSYIESYSGAKPLNNTININSRHIWNPDNQKITETLIEDLRNIGEDNFCVGIHEFVHENRILRNIEAEIQGEINEIVVVSAHLDSTAAYDCPYNPLSDPAPGADDDASGIAGVLTISGIINNLCKLNKPKRNIRFVLFNAEEHGLVGSKAYARREAMLKTSIIAVYQMDMIGYNKVQPRSWEVHVGYNASTEVESKSLVLAQRIKNLAGLVVPDIELPQIYISPDPAAGRSDHASFQERGYAACVVSEDFFAGPKPESPQNEPNPNYHKKTDIYESVDMEYVADIARVVAAAAWVSANIS